MLYLHILVFILPLIFKFVNNKHDIHYSELIALLIISIC